MYRPDEFDGELAPGLPNSIQSNLRWPCLVLLPHKSLLPFVSLVSDPLADVWGTIRERDSAPFAFGKEVDFTLASQGQVFQIKHYTAAGRFCCEKIFHFNYVFLLHSAD
jgi:hypothetical protein